MRSLFIGFGLLGVGVIILPAAADNGPLYVAPGPSNLVPADVIKHSQEQLAGTSRKLGDLLGNSLESHNQPRHRSGGNDQVRTLRIRDHYLCRRERQNTELKQRPRKPKRYGQGEGSDPDIAHR